VGFLLYVVTLRFIFLLKNQNMVSIEIPFMKFILIVYIVKIKVTWSLIGQAHMQWVARNIF
jgi:hypothetical protein